MTVQGQLQTNYSYQPMYRSKQNDERIRIPSNYLQPAKVQENSCVQVVNGFAMKIASNQDKNQWYPVVSSWIKRQFETLRRLFITWEVQGYHCLRSFLCYSVSVIFLTHNPNTSRICKSLKNCMRKRPLKLCDLALLPSYPGSWTTDAITNDMQSSFLNFRIT